MRSGRVLMCPKSRDTLTFPNHWAWKEEQQRLDKNKNKKQNNNCQAFYCDDATAYTIIRYWHSL